MAKAPKTASPMPSNGPPEAKPAAGATQATALPTPPAPHASAVAAAAQAAAQDRQDRQAQLKSLSARLKRATDLRDSLRARARKLEQDSDEYRRYVQDRNRELVQASRDFREAEAAAQSELGEIPQLAAAVAKLKAELGEE